MRNDSRCNSFEGLDRRQQIVAKRCKNRSNGNWKQQKLHKMDTPDAPKPQFRIGSEDVRPVSNVKYLGVQVDQELK